MKTSKPEYLKRTQGSRGDEDKLFISFQKPHKAVSRDTISRWVKQVLEAAGIDTKVFNLQGLQQIRASRCANEGSWMEVRKYLPQVLQ